MYPTAILDYYVAKSEKEDNIGTTGWFNSHGYYYILNAYMDTGEPLKTRRIAAVSVDLSVFC